MHKQKNLLVVILLAAFLLTAFSGAAFAINLTDELTVSEMARFLIRRNFYFTYDDQKIQTEDVKAMVESLGDKYSRYFSPEEFEAYKQELDNERAMLGIYYTQEEGSGLVVSGIIPSSAADIAGLQEGDIITSINGTSTVNLTAEEVATLLTIEEGDSLTLTVQRGEKTLTKTATAQITVIPSVAYDMLESGIGYLYIGEFDEATGQEVKTALSVLRAQGAKVLLLDLRNCPGGLVSSLVQVANYFVPSGPIAFFRYRGGSEEFAKSTGEGYYSDMPVVTLVNQNTASAAEFLAGAMQDTDSSVLIGSKTYGKGLMQNVYSLKDGSGFTLTIAQVFTRNYQNIHENGGIIPDIVIDDVDKQEEVALEMCRNMIFTGTITMHIGSETMSTGRGYINLPTAPIEEKGVTYAPLRQVASAMGAWVDWKNGIITITNGGDTFIIDTINKQIKKNGYNYNASVIEKNGTILIPVRFFAEHMGASVEWYPENNGIQITR